MNITKTTNLSEHISATIREKAPYQKVLVIFDYSMPSILLSEIEYANAKQCVLNKYIIDGHTDIADLQSILNGGTKLAIFAVSDDTRMKINKFHLDLSYIDVIFLPTNANLIPFLSKTGENATLLVSKEIMQLNGLDYTNCYLCISVLLLYCINKKFQHYKDQDALSLNDANERLYRYLHDIDQTLHLSTSDQKVDKFIDIAISHHEWAKDDDFVEMSILLANDLPIEQTLNVSTVISIGILALIRYQHTHTLCLTDVYKKVHSTTDYDYDLLEKYYRTIFDMKNLDILSQYYPTLLKDVQSIIKMLNSITTYLSIERPTLNPTLSPSNINKLLPKIKHSLAEYQNDLIHLTYLYGVYD